MKMIKILVFGMVFLYGADSCAMGSYKRTKLGSIARTQQKLSDFVVKCIVRTYCPKFEPLPNYQELIAAHRALKDAFKPFDAWNALCQKLPKLNELRKLNVSDRYPTALSWDAFNLVRLKFYKILKAGTLSSAECWLNDAPRPESPFFNIHAKAGFKPFVQKITVKPGAKIARHGDLHGDVHSLLEFITYCQKKGFMEGFKIIDPNFYILFLGDYVDRGRYGIEVIYTLMRLKIENPSRVFMARGNHEDASISSRFGFRDELQRKFPGFDDAHAIISRLYDFLPAALLVECNNDCTLNCHGCVDIGYDANPLLAFPSDTAYQWITELPKLTRAKVLGVTHKVLDFCDQDFRGKAFEADSAELSQLFGKIDFMWGDVVVDPKEIGIVTSERGPFSVAYTQDALQKVGAAYTESRLCAVFRAHQHSRELNPMMQSILHLDNDGSFMPDGFENDRGLSKLWRPEGCTESVWSGMICTHLVALNAGYSEPLDDYPGYAYHAFSLQRMGNSFEESPLEVIRLPEASAHAAAAAAAV